jgi:hypothetical protein
MNERYRIMFFGGLSVRQGQALITRFRTQKAAALLAYLAYFPQQAHPREVLIELLWPGGEPQASRASLSQALSTLRRQLEPPGRVPAGSLIRATHAAVQLNPEALTTDVAGFEATLEQAARAGSTAERAQLLRQAVDRYTGELLPGFYEDWVLTSGSAWRIVLRGRSPVVLHWEQTGQIEAALEQARRAALGTRCARSATRSDPPAGRFPARMKQRSDTTEKWCAAWTRIPARSPPRPCSRWLGTWRKAWARRGQCRWRRSRNRPLLRRENLPRDSPPPARSRSF